MDAPTLDRPADRRRAPDAVCAAAVDLARAAAAVEAGDDALVGDHLETVGAGERVVVHRFRCLSPAYVGWVWAVAVVRASRARVATVAEAWCEPGDGALLAPPWHPWAHRVQPGDLGAGDVFPTAADDPRLVPGYTGADALSATALTEPGLPLAWSVGLGRLRVLSAFGRDLAAERWYDGEGGPRSPLSVSAPARCASCGWLQPMGGPLGQAFGVCAHVMSPSDGHVVSLDHGCGAHSEVVAAAAAALAIDPVLDEVGYDALELGAASSPGDEAVDVDSGDVALVEAVEAEVESEVAAAVEAEAADSEAEA